MVNFYPSDATSAIATKCLLLIDDEPDIREIVQVSLACTHNWHVIVAASGQDGLAIAQEHNFDAILLDMNLDAMDGYEVLAQLQQTPHTRQIPVIFLTATQFTDRKIEQSIATNLISGAIQKPFDPGTLAHQIKVLLNW